MFSLFALYFSHPQYHLSAEIQPLVTLYTQQMQFSALSTRRKGLAAVR
jgi:hypothetical protein